MPGLLTLHKNLGAPVGGLRVVGLVEFRIKDLELGMVVLIDFALRLDVRTGKAEAALLLRER